MTLIGVLGSVAIAQDGPASSAVKSDQPEWRWSDARELRIEGVGWKDAAESYCRLPPHAEGVVPKAVWDLAKRTAGVAVRFTTNSSRIAATWDGGGAMNHMAATGNSGLDLYARQDGTWVFVGVGKPKESKTTATLASGLPGKSTEYLLYLPLYSAVTELKIGVAPDAEIETTEERAEPPIVFYGTSITQGGCASRAGMCHASILGRRLDREVINLGFSGAGKMEPDLADLLGELDAAIYVLECLPNMTTEMVAERVAPFVRRLRRVRPTTPILLVENPIHPATNPGNALLRAAFDELVASGIEGICYLEGEDQLAGRENGTVDGVHPTDLGFARMADAYEPVLSRILKTQKSAEIEGQEPKTPGLLPGFELNRHFGEQVMSYGFEPDVSVHINAPSPASFDPRKPTRVVIYALPNGNTIEQTIGKQKSPGVDWHFYIQHIGAQTRRLREVIEDENIVVAYVEAGGRSWPTWRRKHENSGELIAELVDSIRSHFDADAVVDLACHSGGGSLAFGYIENVDELPNWIGRIVLLDANYAYSDEQKHGDKLLAWLENSPKHYLCVIAYDDRRVKVDGKPIVSPTGGTYRATGRMLDRFQRDLELVEDHTGQYARRKALQGRVEMIVVENPEDKILHTVLVERNGLIHGLTFDTPLERIAGEFWGEAAYSKWIQAD